MIASNPVIRHLTPDDAPAVARIAVSSGLFPADATEGVDALVSAYFARTEAEGHVCLVALPPGAAPDDPPVAVAYYEPKPGTDGTWELLMIAVDGAAQGHGYGSALMAHAERDLAGRGQRLLLVQTSGVPSFERTRAFYAGLGYDEEARVRDYYEPGDDMVLFRKALGPVGQSRAMAENTSRSAG